MSVSTYRTTAALPEEFKAKLPSIEDLQHEVEAVAAVVEAVAAVVEEFDRNVGNADSK